MSPLERFFEVEARGSSVAAELRGGFATFLTMAYILLANPSILSAAGVPFESAVACTAAAAGICSILMGLVANFPMALASGMGLNAIVAYQVAQVAGSWQTAMGLVVLDGLIVFALVLVGMREAVMHAIPRDLRRAIGAGIGLFIAFIGAVNAQIVVVPESTVRTLAENRDAVAVPVTFGSLQNPPTAIAVAGLVLTGVLIALRIKGALVIGILLATVVALFGGVAELPDGFRPPSFEAALQADVAGALEWSLLPLLLAFVLVDFFDTLGTTTAISEQAGLQDEQGRVPRLRRVLLVDSASASIGGLFGVSSVTSYIESAAGVAEGARTGLHSVVVGLLFLAAVFAAPIASMVPPAATAPALILVGFLMCSQIARIDFGRYETAIPAFVTLVTVPFTYSISHGIGYGFLTYVGIEVLSGQGRRVHPLMYAFTALFLVYFISASG